MACFIPKLDMEEYSSSLGRLAHNTFLVTDTILQHCFPRSCVWLKTMEKNNGCAFGCFQILQREEGSGPDLPGFMLWMKTALGVGVKDTGFG